MHEWSAQVRFHPWVGSKYSNSPHKVLLLGESHYDVAEPHETYTQDIIQEWCINRNQPGRFFTGIIWVLYGSNEDLEDKFNWVAFYNYVQKFMPAPRIHPSSTDYEEAQKPFLEVLGKLLPDFVVSFGDAMTFHFPNTSNQNNWIKDTVDKTHDVWVGEFNIDNRSIPVYSLPHPSGNKFNMRVYYQYFLEHGLALSL